MSKEHLVNAYLRHSNKNKQSRIKVVCFSNFKMYHDFPVSILKGGTVSILARLCTPKSLVYTIAPRHINIEYP